MQATIDLATSLVLVRETMNFGLYRDPSAAPDECVYLVLDVDGEVADGFSHLVDAEAYLDASQAHADTLD